MGGGRCMAGGCLPATAGRCGRGSTAQGLRLLPSPCPAPASSRGTPAPKRERGLQRAEARSKAGRPRNQLA